MENNAGQPEVQLNPEEVLPPQPEVISIPKAEFEEIKHRADVSSQNFERLKKLEKELAERETQLQDPSVIQDDTEVIGQIRQELAVIKQQLAKQEVLEAYPQLKEVWSEFQTFAEQPENRGMSTKTAAKAFVVEKGLNEPKRKGLERPTGGGHTPLQVGMTPDDIKKLRETNYKKYVDMLKKGQIKV